MFVLGGNRNILVLSLERLLRRESVRELVLDVEIH